jgi:cytoskeleton protein RodZ
MSETAQALGLKLKAEREKRGVSAQKMADDMHLDAWVIDALEAGDYERIGPPVYAKGHLKKYASILGISPDGAEVPKPARSGPAAPVPIIRMDPPPSDVSWPKVGGFAVIVLVAGGIAWWRPWHRSPPAPLAASMSSTESAAEAPQVAAQDAGSASAALDQGADEPSAAAADAPPSVASHASAATPVAAAGSAPALAVVNSSPAGGASSAAAATSAGSTPDLTPGVGRARLRLSFSADSRVDVYDYSGKPVFTGNGRANSVKTIAGMAPFRIYLGFASGVQLQVNDRAVAIGPQFVSGDVARFEAGADGVLRRDARPAATNGSTNGPTNGAPTVAASPRG